MCTNSEAVSVRLIASSALPYSWASRDAPLREAVRQLMGVMMSAEERQRRR